MEVVAKEVTSGEISSLFDIDLVEAPASIADNQTKTDDYAKNLPREVYKSFKHAWSETFDEDSKPPTSDQIKSMYHTWTTALPFDEDAWYEQYEDYYNGCPPPSTSEDWASQDQFNLVSSYLENQGSGIDYTPFIQFVSKFIFDGQLFSVSELNPFLLSSLRIENKDDLPEESGIYFVIDESRIYYIGMSKNLQDRWYSHHRQNDFDKVQNLSIAYIDCLPIGYLRSIEKTLIEHFTPKLNIQHNPLRDNNS